MKCYLQNYPECIEKFGKQTADAILQQVEGMEVVPAPQRGDLLNCNGKFQLEVEMVSANVVHVNFTKVL